MEHEGEVWQELDYNGERLGGIVPAELDEDKVRLFYGTAVMLYRFRDGEIEYLFQHRSKFLKGNPDKWDVSAGGHVNLGESELDGIVREAREEIGANLEKDKLEFATSFLRWKACVVLYFYDWTGKEDSFNFNDDEVEEVKWIKYSELEKFWPNLKQGLGKDKIFEYYVKEWHQRALEKYEDYKS